MARKVWNQTCDLERTSAEYWTVTPAQHRDNIVEDTCYMHWAKLVTNPAMIIWRLIGLVTHLIAWNELETATPYYYPAMIICRLIGIVTHLIACLHWLCEWQHPSHGSSLVINTWVGIDYYKLLNTNEHYFSQLPTTSFHLVLHLTGSPFHIQSFNYRFLPELSAKRLDGRFFRQICNIRL